LIGLFKGAEFENTTRVMRPRADRASEPKEFHVTLLDGFGWFAASHPLPDFLTGVDHNLHGLHPNIASPSGKPIVDETTNRPCGADDSGIRGRREVARRGMGVSPVALNASKLCQ
jgi:hypothetical protein